MKQQIKTLILLLLLFGFLSACSNNSNNANKTVQLDTNSEIITVINIMKPSTRDKSSVLSLLKEGINETMSKQEGYISSNVHASLDNNYIINYSQWQQLDVLAVASDLVNSGGAPKMVEAFTKGKADFHPFKLISQFQANKDTNVFIDAQNKLLTIINILIPKDGVSQDELIDKLNDALENELVSQAGFISSTVHKSIDNNYIINYSQWKDQSSLEVMVKRLQSGNAPKLGLAFSIATPDFHPFSIASTHFKQ